jgi:hypothetical protein
LRRRSLALGSMVTREVRRGMKASTVVAGPGNWLISALGATLEESQPIPGKVHIVVSVSNRSLHRSARAFVINLTNDEE